MRLRTFRKHWDNFTPDHIDFVNNNSAIIIPKDQESTFALLTPGLRNTSGAVYFG